MPGYVYLDTVVLRCGRVRASIDRPTIGVQTISGVGIEVIVLLICIQRSAPAGDIVHRQFKLRREGSFHAEIPLIGPRIHKVLIDAKDGTLWSQLWLDRGNQPGSIPQPCSLRGDECSGGRVRRTLRGVGRDVAKAGVIENTEPTVNDGFAVAEQAVATGSVRETDPRSKVQRVCMNFENRIDRGR